MMKGVVHTLAHSAMLLVILSPLCENYSMHFGAQLVCVIPETPVSQALAAHMCQSERSGQYTLLNHHPPHDFFPSLLHFVSSVEELAYVRDQW